MAVAYWWKAIYPTCDAHVDLTIFVDGFDKRIDAPRRTWVASITGQPISVRFEARGLNVLDLRQSQRAIEGRTEFISLKKLDPGLALSIQEPRGRYDVTLVARNLDEVIFKPVVVCP